MANRIARPTGRSRRPVAAALAALGLASVAGCMTWRTHPDPPRAVTETRGRALRVTTAPRGTDTGGTVSAGETVLLHRAHVAGDSLVGETRGRWPDDAPRRRAIAVAEIRQVATREVAGPRILTAAGGVVAGAAVAVAAWYLLVVRRIPY